MTDHPDPLKPVPPEPSPSLAPAELAGLDPAGLLAGARTPPGNSSRTGAWVPPEVGTLSDALSGYRVTALLGRGGMGAVYEGEQLSLERRVAIKLLPAELGGDPEFQARFKREAKSMARLNHPNIVQIYDFGQTRDGHYYFVMEFVDGTDLHRLIREGKLDVTGALNAVSQICDALQYAHEEGFVHRDIKPANIFINRQGMLKVGDFGLAKLVEGNESGTDVEEDLGGLTSTGVAMGTLNYIAPEQLTQGASVDRRADIYSLGVMFYEMLTREVPRGAVKEPSKRVATLDVRIDGVVFKAMDPDPSERYQTAFELRSDVDVIRTSPAPEIALKEKADGNGVVPPERSKVSVAAPPVRRRAKRKRSPVLAVVGSGFLLLLLIGLAASWFDRRKMVDAESSSFVSHLSESQEGAPPPGEFAKVTKDAPFTNSLGMTFVPLPGTGLLICRHETRKADYAAFYDSESGVGGNFWKAPTEGGVAISTGDTHPVVNVSWEEAGEFCKWLSRKEGRAYRLPSDHEWSVAAGIADVEPPGLSPEELNRTISIAAADGDGNFADQSWSRVLPNRKGERNIDDRFPTTAPVMSFRANALGIYDLAGNVWEHTSDFFEPGRGDISMRGNCWNDSAARLSGRTARAKSARQGSDGFRCVLVVQAEAAGVSSATDFKEGGDPWRVGLSRYQVVEGKSTWAEARSEAERRGGHLATFGTEFERGEVLKRLNPGAADEALLWIGGHGRIGTSEDGWLWVTKEPWLLADRPGSQSAPQAGAATYRYAGLARSGSGGMGITAVSATGGGTRGRGFLMEWEDIDGVPAFIAGDDPKVGNFTNSLGMKLVPVPGTDIYLCLHETRRSDYAAFAAEHPGFSSLWRNPPAFEGVPVGKGDDHPVVMVSWYEARAFCDWLSRKEGRSYRLPTDREWSVAAGLGDFEASEGSPARLAATMGVSLFPWGINLDEAKAGAGNFFDPGAMSKFKGGARNLFFKLDDGQLTTAPVMSFLPNRLGIHDLHGNVLEFCEDRIGPNATSSENDEGAFQYRVMRGGSWLNLAQPLTERNRILPDYRGNDLGFRVALAVAPVKPPSAPLSERTRTVGEPVRFGSSRYQRIEGKVTWGEARERAEQMGGHLATLALEPESQWVEKELGASLRGDGSSLWMGMLFQSGKRWITGEPCLHDRGVTGSPPDSSAIQNQLGGVISRSTDGKIGWDQQPLAGGGSDSPGGFLVEWDDVTGNPPPQASVTTSRESFTNSLGMRFIPVEGSDILLCVHETRRRDYEAFAKEVPGLDPGWKNASFEKLPVGHEMDHPVVMVNWYEARSFCDWLSRKEGRTYRLPTDREWSLAAGLGGFEDANLPVDALSGKGTLRMFWGTSWPPPPGSGNFADQSLKRKLPNRQAIEGYDDGFATTSPVMIFSPSRGFFDLGGNLSEWVEDPWPGGSRSRVLRGGDWMTGGDFPISRRIPDNAAYRRYYFGFRCAVVIESAKTASRRPEGTADSVLKDGDALDSPSSMATSRAPVVLPSSPTVSKGLVPPTSPESSPFFLGIWYQTFDDKASPVYPTDFSADRTVVATSPEGRRSAGKWRLSTTHLAIEWDSGLTHLLPLPVAKEALTLDGEALRGNRPLGSRVRFSRFRPGGEPGELVLSDDRNATGWTVIGNGKVNVSGNAIKLERTSDKGGTAWFTSRKFGDFLLKTDYFLFSGSNTGIMIRAANPSKGGSIVDRGYQIDVSGLPTGKEATGAICLIQAPRSYPQKPGWNQLEIEARGLRFVVRLNGEIVNEYQSEGATEGYIGLQIYKPDGVTFSNLRIQDLK